LIESTTQLLKQLNESLENHRVDLENLQESLAAQTAWCSEQAETYFSESSERSRETTILEKLQEHLTEKFAAVNDYIATRQ